MKTCRTGNDSMWRMRERNKTGKTTIAYKMRSLRINCELFELTQITEARQGEFLNLGLPASSIKCLCSSELEVVILSKVCI